MAIMTPIKKKIINATIKAILSPLELSVKSKASTKQVTAQMNVSMPMTTPNILYI